MNKDSSYTPFEQSLISALNNTIVINEKGIISITSFLTLPESILAFAGHFPGYPVFPAVIQLSVVRILCAEVIGDKIEIKSMGKTKFGGIIRPNEKIKIQILLSKKSNIYDAKFSFVNGEKTASNGSIKYLTPAGNAG